MSDHRPMSGQAGEHIPDPIATADALMDPWVPDPYVSEIVVDPAGLDPLGGSPAEPEPAIEEVDATGKVLIARARTVADADAAHGALQAIAARRGQPVLLLVGEVRLEALDETQMRAAGWVRAEAATDEAHSAEKLARVIDP